MNTADKMLADLQQTMDALPRIKKSLVIYPNGMGNEPAIVLAKQNPMHSCIEDKTGTLCKILILEEHNHFTVGSWGKDKAAFFTPRGKTLYADATEFSL